MSSNDSSVLRQLVLNVELKFFEVLGLMVVLETDGVFEYQAFGWLFLNNLFEHLLVGVDFETLLSLLAEQLLLCGGLYLFNEKDF